MTRPAVLSIVHVYPTLLGLYGDRGNALVLAHRAAARDIAADLVSIDPGDPIPRLADIYLIGGGEDGAQTTATELLRRDGGLTSAIERGAVVLAVCAGLQVLGTTFAAAGGSVAGLALVDMSTTAGTPRAVGELLTEPAELDVPTLSGFENHAGRTALGPGVAPLGRVLRGVGNGTPAEPNGRTVDGFVEGHVVGTYLHGPVLARNPQLADVLLGWATGEQLTALEDRSVEALRAERLAAVGSSQLASRGWRRLQRWRTTATAPRGRRRSRT